MLTQTQVREKTFFTEMQSAFIQLEHESLKNVLLDTLQAEQDSVSAIDASFQSFTAKKHSLRTRRQFFASWQRTNNTAMSVEGLASRITQKAEQALFKGENSPVALELFRSAGRLNRVTDEDLGVKGQILHFELYYRMATKFSDNDDAWQSREFCLPAASEFKSWLDSMRLTEPIINGLFSMLIHEGYTHAELEMIAPMFENWAIEIMGLDKSDARRCLTWISVHNGGTEKLHFEHACAALNHYCNATTDDINLEIARQVFQNYFRRKGEVMKRLNEVYLVD
jgi:hypothetical protein